MLNYIRTLVAIVSLLVLAGCAGSGRQDLPAPVAAAPVLSGGTGLAALPVPSSFPKGASSVNKVKGSDAIDSGNAVLDPAGGRATLKKPAPGGSESLDFSYAIYRLGPFTKLPEGLKFDTNTQYKAKFWIGYGDFQLDRWNWKTGSFKGAPSVSPQLQFPDPTPYLDENGYLLLAVVLDDDAEAVVINDIRITTLNEPTNVNATTNRWDGVKLTWDSDSEADAMNVYRRIPAVDPLPWDLLTPDGLPRYTVSLMDSTAEAGVEYEYKVEYGIQLDVAGVLTWFYGEGSTDRGRRLGSVLGDVATGISEQWPVNLRNYLSFFYMTEEQSSPLSAVRSETYPPYQNWQFYTPGVDNFGPTTLMPSLDGIGEPFAALQNSTTNNPLISMGFTTSEGVFSQVAQVEIDGTVSFEAPVNVRPGETGIHFIGFTQIPRHLMALMWNGNASRLEMMQTFDDFGRQWFIFDPIQAPWQIVTSKRPVGRVDYHNIDVPIYVCFCNSADNKPVVMYLDSGWHDISPNLNVGPGPRYESLLVGGMVPGAGLVYLTQDQQALKVARRSQISGWMLGDADLTTIAQSADGQPISEFDIYNNGAGSHDTYAAFIQGGQLYVSHCEDSGFDNWSAASLVDPALDLHDLHVLLVGTDADNSTYIFATYIKADAQGVDRLNFRDLKIAFADSQQ